MSGKAALLNDVVDFINGKSVDPAASAAAAESTEDFVPFESVIYDAVKGDSQKHQQLKSLVWASGAFGAATNKDVTSVDVGPVRISSLYPIIAQIVNLEFKLLRLLASKTPYRCTDIDVRIPEENIGNDILPFFNVDGSLPPVSQSILTERYNNLGAIGQQINASFMASELAAQSPYRRDELANQMQKAFIRINRSMNKYLWSTATAGGIATGEAVGETPVPGGFYDRSTANVAATGGSNLTDAFISGRVDAMATSFGYDGLEDMVAFTNNTQISVIRNLMINRYPGNDPMKKMEYDNELMTRVRDLGQQSVQMIYEDNNGLVIPFIRDMQMPSSVTMFFKAALLQLGLFQLQGQFGPWMLERPITTLYRLYVAFNLFTLVDPLIVSRAVLTGHP
jgi:hypothetical protein